MDEERDEELRDEELRDGELREGELRDGERLTAEEEARLTLLEERILGDEILGLEVETVLEDMREREDERACLKVWPMDELALECRVLLMLLEKELLLFLNRGELDLMA